MKKDSLRKFGLIGKALSHSFSKRYFTEKFQKEGIFASYELFELASISDLPELIRQHPNLEGLNVTIPYKSEVIPFLDEISESAQQIGAINVIRIEQEKLTGYNSDILGFEASVIKWLDGFVPDTILILGTGGAAKAAEYVIKTRFPESQIWFGTRNPREENHLGYTQLVQIDLSTYPLLINTSPLGMYPDTDSCPIINYESIQPGQFLMDLIYNPKETEFLKRGKRRGASILNGMEMLILQAEAAWGIWNKE